MSLFWTVLLVRASIIFGLVLVWAYSTSCSSTVPGVVVVGVLAIPFVSRLLVQDVWKKRAAAIAVEDFVAARRLSADLLSFSSSNPTLADVLQFDEAFMLMEEGRFGEALPLLTRLLRAVQKPETIDRVQTLNSLAWCNAHLGETQVAETQAVEAVELATLHAHPALSYCLGTLGAVLVLAKREAPAVAVLERALEMGGDQRAQAIRSYFLGDALRALGRDTEAIAAFKRTMSEAPVSQWARLAQKKIRPV